LISLSIGIVAPEAVKNCQSHIEISDLAAQAKHQAKQMTGNSYFVNRRIPSQKNLGTSMNSFCIENPDG
jgi:hypothetical protein